MFNRSCGQGLGVGIVPRPLTNASAPGDSSAPSYSLAQPQPPRSLSRANISPAVARSNASSSLCLSSWSSWRFARGISIRRSKFDPRSRNPGRSRRGRMRPPRTSGCARPGRRSRAECWRGRRGLSLGSTSDRTQGMRLEQPQRARLVLSEILPWRRAIRSSRPARSNRSKLPPLSCAWHWAIVSGNPGNVSPVSARQRSRS